MPKTDENQLMREFDLLIAHLETMAERTGVRSQIINYAAACRDEERSEGKKHQPKPSIHDN